MARKDYQIDEVIRSLSQKHDVHIDERMGVVKVLTDTIPDKQGNQITNPEKKFDLGNGSWGKIDYLVNHCNYLLVRVGKFNNK